MAFGIKANVRAPHRFLRMGALCWLHRPNPGGGDDKVMVVGMSRGGRMVKTYVDSRDLGNWRAGWIANDPPYPDSDRFPFDTKDEAAAFAAGMQSRHSSSPVRPYAAAFGRTPAAQPDPA